MPPPKQLTLDHARRVAYDLLSRRAWSRAELTARLLRRGAPVGVVRQVVGELDARGYLDDRAFARQWVEGRFSLVAAGERQEQLYREWLTGHTPRATLVTEGTRTAVQPSSAITLAKRRYVPAVRCRCGTSRRSSNV